MSSFNNKFASYSMTQLNEFVEDDEKLAAMVQEMDEVRCGPHSFPPSVTGLFSSSLVAFYQHDGNGLRSQFALFLTNVAFVRELRCP